jgi:hypothetical protein
VAISIPFLSRAAFLLTFFYIKVEGAFENFKNPPAALFLGQIYPTT